MPSLARHLQERFAEECPPGWNCHPEAAVIGRETERLLGYAPRADILLQSEGGRRVWIELEVSRADPVANHAKFATSHLVAPFPATDSFISMVSRHVAVGRRNLASHTIALMRLAGMRAFQTTLLPALDGAEIKRLNHLAPLQLREQSPGGMRGDLARAIQIATPLETVLEHEIHFAANPVEVTMNVRQWNQDIARPGMVEAWGRRRRQVRYFAHDPISGHFAPSKFASYLLLPLPGPATTRGATAPTEAGEAAQAPPAALTGLSIPRYVKIDQDLPIFDGGRAWHHLANHLRFQKHSLSEAPEPLAQAFHSWLGQPQVATAIAFSSRSSSAKDPILLAPPAWA